MKKKRKIQVPTLKSARHVRNKYFQQPSARAGISEEVPCSCNGIRAVVTAHVAPIAMLVHGSAIVRVTCTEASDQLADASEQAPLSDAHPEAVQPPSAVAPIRRHGQSIEFIELLDITLE